jgi:multiple antibiotic resistance protein
MDTLSAAIMLFLIMDPLGNLPIVMSVLKPFEPKRRLLILARELLFSLIILLIFLYSGDSILAFLNIKQETVSIAGGIILFLIALKMIFPSPGGVMNLPAGEEPFIVPLAIPMIAGPSSMAALILLSNQAPTRIVDWTLALIGAWGLSAIILLFSGPLHKILGQKGLSAVERLMGMILIMLSIQLLLDGVSVYLQPNTL